MISGKLTITITVANAAFDDGAQGEELARILTDAARYMSGLSPEDFEDPAGFPLRDLNGNRAGEMQWTPEGTL